MGDILYFADMKKFDGAPPNRIREIRQRRGLTQQELGERIGRTNNQVSRFETGDRPIYLETLRLIARALDCTVGDLLSEADNPYRLSGEERHVVDYMRADPRGRDIFAGVASGYTGFAAEPAAAPVSLDEHRARRDAG